MTVNEFTITMEQINAFEFRVKFDKDQYAELHMDEPPPLGKDAAPSAVRVLAAAIGNCLSASLLFCTQRAGQPLAGLRSEVKVQLVRNDQKRIRVGTVNVTLRPKVQGDRAVFDKCLGTFEDFCTVTQSVREGIDVKVNVEPE